MKSEEDRINELKNISHDLQNILSAIVNNAKLLKQNVDSSSSTAKYATVIENNSLRAAEIIQEFLSNKKTQKRKINASILFNDITSSFANMLSSNVKFEFKNESNEILLFGNYTELFRTFLNLLINAKEAIHEKGNIIFEIHKTSDGRIIFSVKDNGSGIPHDIIDKIFEPGFSTKSKNRESGIGLNIVKNIIEDHKGTVEVISEINKGTEFQISFPIINDTVEDVFRNKKILIADDDNDLRESLADLFESYGFTPILAGDGLNVVDIVKEGNNVDLLILDKKMPGKDGLQCISEIRSFNKEIPIILVTGVNFEENELEEINTKNYINNIVQKPYDFIYLIEIVEKLIL